MGVHTETRETVRFPARTCPRSPADGRASFTRPSLVMKGSAVRVRASALGEAPLRRGFLVEGVRSRSRSANISANIGRGQVAHGARSLIITVGAASRRRRSDHTRGEPAPGVGLRRQPSVPDVRGPHIGRTTAFVQEQKSTARRNRVLARSSRGRRVCSRRDRT